MPSIEDQLLADAAGWQLEIDKAASRVSRPSNVPPGRRRVLSAVAAIAAVVVIAVGASLVVHLRSNKSDTPAATKDLTTASYMGLQLTYPTIWKTVKPTFATAAVEAPIAFLTNAVPVAQCTAGSCHAPVTNLDKDQILITIVQQPFVRSLGHLNGLVAGRPALITQGTVKASCPQGVAQYLFADIALPGANSGIGIHACLGADNVELLQQLHQMIDDAQYH